MLFLATSFASGLVLPAAPSMRAAARAHVSMAERISMDEQVLAKYMALPVEGKVQAEYLWLDAVGEVRSKCRTVTADKATVDKLPSWNYDGSSTDQAPGDDSEVIIKPRAVFKDPFRGGDNILVLTDTYTPGGTPLPTNTRAPAEAIFSASDESSGAWFGLEQEYTLFNMDKVTPLGWPAGGYPGPQGPYYCGAGAEYAARCACCRLVPRRRVRCGALLAADPSCVRRACDAQPLVRPRHLGGALQGVPFRRPGDLGHQRRGDAGSVGVPDRPMHGHRRRHVQATIPSHSIPLP